MKIAVLGAGALGTALAKRLAPHGHEITLTVSRDAKKLARVASDIGVDSSEPQDAISKSDVVAVALPWAAAASVASQYVDVLRGKAVWDCTNPMKPDFSGLELGLTTSAAERLQAMLPDATVVKGIPPFAELLQSADPTVGGERVGSFVCGPDGTAKDDVMTLLRQLPADPLNAGPLENARYTEPAAFLLVRLAYGSGMGARIGLSFLNDE